MKMWGIGFFQAVFLGAAVTMPIGALAAGPSALQLGYCASDFDACYNFCRIDNPGASFASDQARVACGQSCLQRRYQCEGRTGMMQPQPQARPQPAAPSRMVAPAPTQQAPAQPAPSARAVSPPPAEAAPTEAPRLTTPRPLTVQRAPAAASGADYVPPPPAPTTTPSAQPAARAQTQEKETGIWRWFRPRDRKDSIIPGK